MTARAVRRGGAAAAGLAGAARRGARREPAHPTAYRRDVVGLSRLPGAALGRAGGRARRSAASRPPTCAPGWRASAAAGSRRARWRGRCRRSRASTPGSRRRRASPRPAVTATRGRGVKPRLPRPVAPDAARALIATVEAQSLEPWIAARDVAVVTLLYGCGLRISEALALRQADAPLGRHAADPRQGRPRAAGAGAAGGGAGGRGLPRALPVRARRPRRRCSSAPAAAR